MDYLLRVSVLLMNWLDILVVYIPIRQPIAHFLLASSSSPVSTVREKVPCLDKQCKQRASLA